MTLSHETLAPLVGKIVTVTRNDIPGATTGFLADLLDGCISIDHGGGKGQIIALKWVQHISLAGEPGSPTPSRYQWSYKGVSFDFYRLCEILGIEHHAQARALKKVIRAGRSVKSLETDIDEAIACLSRWKEMVLEDKQ